MKLGKKIRYIVLPIIILVSGVITGIYYDIYKTQIIENELHSLNQYLENSLSKTKYDINYARSYLQNRLDSKEASFIFIKNERGERVSASYIGQFFDQFINRNTNEILNNNIHTISDFIIYDAERDDIVHINTESPFNEPILKKQTKKLFDKIESNSIKKISKYYYFVDDTKNKNFNIIQVFSPYKLTSQQFYDPNDSLYIIQAQIGLKMIRNAVKELVDDRQQYISSTVDIKKGVMVDKITTTFTPFDLREGYFYQSEIDNDLFKIKISLDEKYFSNELNNTLIKLVFFGFIVIGLVYFVVVKVIEKQIIFPITDLAKSIKQVEASLAFELKPLNTNDEVSDLNESYILLIRKINDLANNDSLTGLSNRRSFTDTLTSLNQKDFETKNYIALYFIDLDNFKYVNDTCGHEAGDLLLVEFSQRLKKLLSVNCKVISGLKVENIARLGGDEFVVLLNGLPSMMAIEDIGKSICTLFHDDFNIGVNQFNVHASVGVSYRSANIESGEILLHQADSAMYIAKKMGKNNYKIFTSEIEEKISNDLKVENQLIGTLDNNQLVLVFMPSYTAKDMTLKGYEVLLRCPSLTNVGIGPDVFIPIAEKTDLILMIDLWVAENTFIKLKELVEKTGFEGFFAMNMSSKSLRNDDFYFRLKALIELYSIDVKQIELEITETCLMPDDYQAISSLKKLKSLGVSIAIDDFGTGYTSFNQLVNYPLDTLKIDQSFVRSLGETEIGKKPTLDIIYELAKIYELEVIVEGIETASDFEYVKKFQDVIMQGYYFTMPCKWEEVLAKHKE